MLFRSEQQTVSQELKCGPFDFCFWYWQGEPKNTSLDEALRIRINEKLKYSGGIMIYRDGLRVLPYGIPENDWLNIEERRSKGAGYYHFSYRRMFGYITIDAKKNPALIDKAGREGMIKNAAYRDLRSTLETFLKQLSTQFFYKNPEFRAKQVQIQSENTTLQNHKKTLSKRRENLLEKINKSLSNIEQQQSRILSYKEEVVQRLNDSNLSIEQLEEIVNLFEKRILQLLGESKVTIPKNLSLGRGIILNQVVYDYEVAYKELREEAELAREVIIDRKSVV